MDSSLASGANNKRTALFAAIGGLAVLAVVLLAVLVIPASQTTATSPSSSASSAAAAGPAPLPGATVAPATGTADAVAVDVTADPVVVGGDPTTPAKKPAGGTAATTTRPEPTVKATATATATVKPPDPPPVDASASGPGTLVAIAVGGTCAFSVNGASKGTTNSVKLSVPPGNYTVSCKPSSGASKSKSVQVKSGATAMAMFKL